MGFSDLKRKFKRIEQSFQDKQNNSSAVAERKLFSRTATHQHIDNEENELFSKPIESTLPSIFRRIEHNQIPKGCRFGKNDEPIQTNNFYNNLTLEDQTCPVWTQPYSLWYTNDPSQVVGLAINHTEASQRVFGPDPSKNPAQFYFNPPKIKSLILSGEGLVANGVQLQNHQKLSVIASMNINNESYISIPLVLGMGFITAVYRNMRPIIASEVGVQDFKKISKYGNITRYEIKLFNQVNWSLYVDGNVNFTIRDSNHIVGDTKENVTVQICKGISTYYDESAGIYPVAAHLQGSANGSKGNYTFAYEMNGACRSGKGLVWCFPHHQESLIASIKRLDTGLRLESPTKGIMKCYATNKLTMEEKLPIDISWEPWATFSMSPRYSETAILKIREAAAIEVDQDIVGMADTDSMYTSGKILDKFAFILYVCHEILQDEKLTSKLLPKIKEAIEIFANNKQKFPLIYDSTWKGIISSAEPAADFGNSNYNDHHFHYGYHVHAISLVAKVDRDWLYDNDSLVYNYAINLIKDVANPVSDRDFPQSRSFDWFHGHSFAHGIFASGDGKDEESSSEDYHFAYGMKLFAIIIGDIDIENRANLMLAIMRRSMNLYMLYTDDNEIQPKNFIKNKVAGITFENKIDFATYFGRGSVADEWIHGIHMLPITPVSSYVRGVKFVKEEWDQKLSKIIDRIPDGWKGILILNSALFDPAGAWEWFSRDNWDPALIDNGMSRTWSLAFIAGIGGAD